MIKDIAKTMYYCSVVQAMEDKTYDYIGVFPPIGIRKPRRKLKKGTDYICFDKDDIESVIYIGYSDEKSDTYSKLTDLVKNKLDETDDVITSESIKDIIEDNFKQSEE